MKTIFFIFIGTTNLPKNVNIPAFNIRQSRYLHRFSSAYSIIPTLVSGFDLGW